MQIAMLRIALGDSVGCAVTSLSLPLRVLKSAELGLCNAIASVQGPPIVGSRLRNRFNWNSGCYSPSELRVSSLMRALTVGAIPTHQVA
jgi:hypothetical protein